MKKVSTLKVMALLCAVPFFVNGQSASRLQIRNSQAEKLVKVAPGSEIAAMPMTTAATVRNISATAKRSAAATIVGSTTYDLQSNGSTARRLLAYPDGKVTVSWTGSTDPGTTWPDRGGFTNSYNGTAWGTAPTARSESKRTGWPNIVNTTDSGEVIISHVNAVTRNTGPGTAFGTTRNAGEFRGLTWARAASSGNNIHAIISTSAASDGFAAPVFYGRSTNAGASFDTVSANFAVAAGYDTVNHAGDVGADSYEIAARGNVVAIAIAGTTEDVVLLKSTDNGTTWTRTIVRAFPMTKYVSGITDADGDGVADTLLGTTGNISVAIDNQNVVHVSWCDLLVFDADGAGLSVFLTATSDYINYWNDADKNIIEVPVLLDKDGNGSFDAGTAFTGGGTIRYGNSGYSLNPQLSVGAAGTAWADRIFLTYAAVAENDTNDVGVDFRSIFVTGTPNRGQDWYEIQDASQTQNVENVFVCTSREVGADGKIHMLWQQDFEPGNAVQGQHPAGPSDIIYNAFDATSLRLGVGNSKKLDAAIVAFPNPTSDVANFSITLNNASKAELKLVNMLGQTVRTMNVDLNAGANKVSMNVEDLTAGLYTMVLTSNGKSATEKIMVK
jgi:hypothetical protein